MHWIAEAFWKACAHRAARSKSTFPNPISFPLRQLERACAARSNTANHIRKQPLACAALSGRVTSVTFERRSATERQRRAHNFVVWADSKKVLIRSASASSVLLRRTTRLQAQQA
jgi:hypothetical protein